MLSEALFFGASPSRGKARGHPPGEDVLVVRGTGYGLHGHFPVTAHWRLPFAPEEKQPFIDSQVK